MSDWKGKARGNILGYRIFVWLLQKLDVTFSYFVLRFVVLYFLFFSPKAVQATFRYYRAIHHLSLMKSLIHLYKNYFVFGKTLLDRLLMFSGLPHKFEYEFINTDSIRQTIESGKSVILVGAHIGNWEVANYMMKHFNCKKINVVFIDAENEKIKNYLNQVQGLKKVEIELHPIFIRQDMQHVIEIHSALSKGEVVFIQGDRYLPGSKTITAPLLGQSADFPLSTFQLASRFQHPVFCIFGMKHSNYQYRLYASEDIRQVEGLSNAQAVHKLLAAYTAELEKMLQLYPDQWFNYYQFWKKSNGTT